METLSNEQIKATSGGSQGVYHERGISHQINCPSISQHCLDKFLICANEILSSKEIHNCLDAVANDCGAYTLSKTIECVDTTVYGIQ